MASSPAIIICTVCHMYSLSISVGDEGFTCDKCREIARLTETVLELETRIQTLVEDSKNVRAVDTALDVTSSGTPVHCSVPVEPVQQGNWVTVAPFTLHVGPGKLPENCRSAFCVNANTSRD